jgi:hypothetical protein
MSTKIEKQTKITVEDIFSSACKLPYCKVDREKFLIKQLSGKVTGKQLNTSLDSGTINAGINIDLLDKLANACIKNETAKAASMSTLAGIPGGLAMVGTVPADLAQYYAHIFRITQKLAYIYGYDELILDDAAENSLMLFLGVMFGVNFAVAAITKVAAANAVNIGGKIAAKPLTKIAVYRIAKKVLSFVGIRLTKDMAGKAIAKVVPVIGGITSGGLTLATFMPMSKKLKNTLSDIAKMSPEDLEKASKEADKIILDIENEPEENFSKETIVIIPDKDNSLDD